MCSVLCTRVVVVLVACLLPVVGWSDALENPEFEQGDLSSWDVDSEVLSIGVSTLETFNRNYSARIHGSYSGDSWSEDALSQTIVAKGGNKVRAEGFLFWSNYVEEVAAGDGYLEAVLSGPFGEDRVVWTNVHDTWTFFSVSGAVYGVTEGGFEAGSPAGWVLGLDDLMCDVVTNEVYEGDYAAHLSGSWAGWSFNQLRQTFHAEAGDVLTVGGRMFINEFTSTLGGTLAGLKLERVGGGAAAEQLYDTTAAVGEWLDLSVSLTVVEEGDYNLMCLVMGGTGGEVSASLYFDSISLVRNDDVPGYVYTMVGKADSTDTDFLDSNYTTSSVNLDAVSASTNFPKFMTDSWWCTQEFHCVLSAAQTTHDLVVTLDPFWSDGAGTLTLALDIKNGAVWTSVGQVDVSGTSSDSITIPQGSLVTGLNRFRLRTVTGNGDTHALTWDQIKLESEGVYDPAYDVTLNVAYHGYSGGAAYESEVDIFADAFTIRGSTADIGRPEDIFDILSAQAAAIAQNPAKPIPEVEYPPLGTYGYVGDDSENLNYPAYVEGPFMGWSFRTMSNAPVQMVQNTLQIIEDGHGPAFIEFDMYQYISKYSHTLRGDPLQLNTNDPYFKLGERDDRGAEFGEGPFPDVYTYTVGDPLSSFPRCMSTVSGDGWPIKMTIEFEEDLSEHNLNWDKFFVLATVPTNGPDSNIKIMQMSIYATNANNGKEVLLKTQDMHMGWGAEELSYGRMDYPNMTYQDRNMTHSRSGNDYGLIKDVPDWFITQTPRAGDTVEPMTLYILQDGGWLQHMYEEYFFLWPSAASGVRSIFDDDSVFRLDGPASYYVSYKLGHSCGTNEYGEPAYWQLFEARGCGYYRMMDYHAIMAGSLRPMAANVFGLHGREETFLIPDSYTRAVARTTPTNELDDSYAEVYSIVRSRTNQAFIAALKTTFNIAPDQVGTNGAYLDLEMDTWANRDWSVEEEGPLCLFAQASMHWRGHKEFEINEGTAGHDVDVVMVQKPDGEWITHQMQNPPTGVVHSTMCDFRLGDVIYIQQQDRAYDSYCVHPEAPYEQASSFEITLLDDPGVDSTVDIYECHTKHETDDNVDITCNINEDFAQGDNLHYKYRYRCVFAPGVTIVSPNDSSGGESWQTGGVYQIKFHAMDYYRQPLIANLYYGNGRDNEWNLINTEGPMLIPTNVFTTTYDWDVSGVPEGAYYIKATAQTGPVARVGFDVSNSRIHVKVKQGFRANGFVDTATNVVGNPYLGNDLDFASGNKDVWNQSPTHWNENAGSLAMTITNEPSVNGLNSLQMQGQWAGWNWSDVRQMVPVVQGEKLQVTAKVYVKALQEDGGGQILCGIKVESTNSACSDEERASDVGFSASSVTTGQWLTVAFDRTVPYSGMERCLLYLFGNDCNTAEVYFADLKIVSTNWGAIHYAYAMEEFWRGDPVDVSGEEFLRICVEGTNQTDVLEWWVSDAAGATNRVAVTNYLPQIVNTPQQVFVPWADLSGLDLTQITAMGQYPADVGYDYPVISGVQSINKPVLDVSAEIVGAPADDLAGLPMFNQGEVVTNIISLRNTTAEEMTGLSISAVHEYGEQTLWWDWSTVQGTRPQWSARTRVGERMHGDFLQVWTNQSIAAGETLVVTNRYVMPTGKYIFQTNHLGEVLAEYYTYLNYDCHAQVSVTVRDSNGDGVFIDDRTVVYSMDTDFDIDNDGLLDAWETQYFGDRTIAEPDVDSDGDTYSNQEEHDAGTNPLDENDYPVGNVLLTVAGSPSAYGACDPYDYGDHMIMSNKEVTCSVGAYVYLAEDERRHCVGWTGTGSAPSSGTDTQVTFTLDQESTLTWLWEPEYALNESRLFYGVATQTVTESETILERGVGVWGNFGYAVSMDENLVAVGVEGPDGAYVFRKAGDGWVQEDKVVGDDLAFGDHLGRVALSGNLLAAGCWEDDDRGGEAGTAYLFERTGMSWLQIAKLNGSQTIAGDHFGWSVDIDDDTVLIGAPGPYYGGHPGSVYVFTNAVGTWTESTILVAGDGALTNRFGAAVALDGDVAAVGVHAHVQDSNTVGAVCVYRRSAGVWGREAFLINPDPEEGDAFGCALDVVDGTVLIGASGDDEAGPNAGAVYVAVFTNAAWTIIDKIAAAEPSVDMQLGHSVDVHDGFALVGAPGVMPGGAVLLLHDNGLCWEQAAMWKAETSVAGMTFGYDVALSYAGATVGAPTANGLGVVYAYDFAENTEGASTWYVDTALASTAVAGLHYTNAAGEVYSFNRWTVDGVEQPGNPLAGIAMAGPRNAVAQYEAASECVHIALGADDSSDAEFNSGMFPTCPLDLGSVASAIFPRELNCTWWSTQCFYIVMSERQAVKDLEIRLDAAWSMDDEPLRVLLESFTGTAWEEVARDDVVAGTLSYLRVPAAYLHSGSNDLRFVGVHRTFETNALTWDQISAESVLPQRDICIVLGSADRSTDEFRSWTLGFPTNSMNMDIIDSEDFPCELNDNWWGIQNLHFALYLAENSQDVIFTLRPFWSGGEGTLTVALDVPSGVDTWQQVDQTDLCSGIDARLSASVEHLQLGNNVFRLRTVTGAQGTHAVNWDQIMVTSERMWVRDGDQDGMSDAWEMQYGLNMALDDSMLDEDEDGMTNLEECYAGTCPHDAESLLHITCPQGAVEGTLWWTPMPGRMYDVFGTESLTNAFAPIALDLPATLPIGGYTDTVARGDCFYYMIKAKTP